jgi:YD repeat-containing protein
VLLLRGDLRVRSLMLVFGFFVAVFPAQAAASETILYTYDARGRLVEVERQQPTTSVKTKYTYDRADNRTKKEVTTTP